MEIEIFEKEFNLEIFGFSAEAINKDYGATAFKLMDKMWQVIKREKINNRGKNIWVYEPADMVFAGVELEDPASGEGLLERKKLHLKRYAYCRHIGPYNLIKKTGEQMISEIKNRNYLTGSPYFEIYGHWKEDESKLVTELFMNLD